MGSYLAAVTAFMVQNVGPLLPAGLEWTVWALPGLLGGVGISYWVTIRKSLRRSVNVRWSTLKRRREP